MDIEYLCKTIGNLAGVPVRIYQGPEKTFFYFIAPLPYDPVLLCLDELLKFDGNIASFLTDDLSYYSVLRVDGLRIMIGPTRHSGYSEQELKTIAFRLNVPSDELDDFVLAMNSIVHMPVEILLQILCMVFHILSGKKLSLRDVVTLEAQQNHLRHTEKLIQPENSELMPDHHAALSHNTLAIEETLMNMVSHGDTAALHAWVNAAPAVRGGVLAEDQLRQLKNMMIVTTTLTSRAAIRGGLDQEIAFSLSDQFIQACEKLRSPEQINNLQIQMLIQFTERVERIRRGTKTTNLSIAVSNYIQRHLSESISVENLAKELFISRTYLSAKFKEETGETLTDFILEEKTEEGKRLLRYTDKTISQIGFFLGFSSSAHFSKVFRKYAGITPTEYRTKHGHLYR